MQNSVTDINEQRAATAFTKQSFVFDDIYANNTIIHYKRDRVRAHIKQYLQPQSSILELNSGTGEDAIWFAKQDHAVHATDIAEGMQQILKKKIKADALEEKITTELCSFAQLETLVNKGPYDLIFSNFAGLNCTRHLDRVLLSFSSLLKPNGIVTLVILPGFCLWETLLLFKGKFKTAFRRFFIRNGANANVEGEHFKCWYYHPSFVIKSLAPEFDVLSVEGLCTIVPPSYIENFAGKHSGIFNWLKKKEDRYKNSWPWKNIGDYYIITLQKRQLTRINAN
jgi:ubiquinone/menaquinone biosynthesis C-methylase UbiE